MSGAIVPGSGIENGATTDCDVAIVGSGAAGGAAAARLAEAGLEVVVLEEGGHYTKADFTRSVTDAMGKLYRDGGLSVIHGRPNIVFQEGRCVGGGTVVNGGMAWRPPERAMERWHREHGLEFMTAEAMEPYFEAVEEAIHVDWQDPESVSEGETVFFQSAESLGIPVTLNRRNQRRCRGSNICVLGCPDDRKQSVHITYVPRALAAGARVYTDCRVVKLTSEGGRARGVVAEVLDRETGRRRGSLTVRAKCVFLAGGALQTPALLQRNRLGGRRVGKNLLCHPNVKVLGVYDRDLYQWKGVHQGHQIHHFLDEGILLASGGVPPAVVGMAIGRFGAANLRMMEQFHRMFLTAALIEDTTSGSVRALPGGVLWPRYQIDELQVERMRKGTALLAEIHFNAGARRVLLPFAGLPEIRSMDEVAKIAEAPIKRRDIEVMTVHAMGTCAMGSDPRRHVVRPSGECWQVPDLFIGDASVLPASPGLNPQVSIQAVALRVADRIAERFTG